MTTSISELEAIRKAANLYGEGLQTGDIELLKKVFHPRAMMYGITNPDLMVTEIQGLYDYVAAHPAPAQSGEPHKYLITKVDFAGNAASVEMIQESYQGINYINYFQLLKIDGNWMIVSKSFDVIRQDTELSQSKAKTELMEA